MSYLDHCSVYTNFYYENFLNFLPLKKKDGKIIADWPLLITDGPLGGYSVAETGAYVREAFSNPKEWISTSHPH